MELTPEEAEFIERYRALSPYEKLLVQVEIDTLKQEEEKRERLKDWKLCKEEGNEN